MTPNEDAALRRAVRELRHEISETQACFAARLRVTIATVIRWENLRAPKGSNLFRLAMIAAPIRPDLEHKFLLAMVDVIEEGYSITPHIWQRLADVARSRQTADGGTNVQKRAE